MHLFYKLFSWYKETIFLSEFQLWKISLEFSLHFVMAKFQFEHKTPYASYLIQKQSRVTLNEKVKLNIYKEIV